MSLYDADFYEWTREQSAALRRRLSERANTDLDLENLAEEIESLGNRDRRAIESTIARIVEHFLKLEYSRSLLPRRGWTASVAKQRVRLKRLFRDNPSLRANLDLHAVYADGRRMAVAGLAQDTFANTVLPESCPYTLDQIENDDFWPERKSP